jgi:hypothetical protein
LTPTDVDDYNKSFRAPAYLEECSLIFLAFVLPIAVYSLVLSVINRKSHPVVVPGPWDFAGVLFAASGFLLLGGPAILTGTYEQWRLSWLLGQTRHLQGIGENWNFWISLWFVYFAVVGGISVFVLWRRRTQISIYNIEPPVFAEVLTDVLDRLGLEWRQNGPQRVLLRFRESPLSDVGARIDSIHVPPRSERGEPRPHFATAITQDDSSADCPWSVLAVEPFPALRHVTVHWLSHHETTRLEVDAELTKALLQVRAAPSPVSGWFLALSLGLFFLVFVPLLTFVTVRILQLLRL